MDGSKCDGDRHSWNITAVIGTSGEPVPVSCHSGQYPGRAHVTEWGSYRMHLDIGAEIYPPQHPGHRDDPGNEVHVTATVLRPDQHRGHTLG